MAHSAERFNKPRLKLVSAASDLLCREFASAAKRCGFATRRVELTGTDPSQECNLVAVCGSRAGACALAEWFRGQAGQCCCFGVFSSEAVTEANWLKTCCFDFLVWPTTLTEVGLRLQRFYSIAPAPPSSEQEKPDLTAEFAILNLVGRSAAFLRVIEQAKRIASTEATVLIEGATGTGKELVARAIHYLGPRRKGPFVPVNCGALPDTLVENELFGHERGAFTDARIARGGMVEEARRGTLFLDEVETLSPKGQVILLRFLQDQEFRPLGGRGLRQADVRILVASNSPLRKLVDAGRFREDLFYRMSVLKLMLPPLSARIDDIALLARRILAKLHSRYGGRPKSLHPLTLARLERKPWPGNVRELENFLHRAYVLCDSDTITISDEIEELSARVNQETFQKAKARVIARFEHEYLIWLMAQANGNVTKAASIAGKERRSLGRLLKKHGLRPSRR